MGICPGYGLLDLTSTCIRSVWATIPPTLLTVAILLVILLTKLPSHAFLALLWKTLSAPFKAFLTLQEAETYNEDEKGEARIHSERGKPHQRAIWHATAISLVSLVEAGIWLALGSASLVKKSKSWMAWSCIITAFPWIYATIRPFARPTATPPFDLFWIFILKLATSALYFGGLAYDAYVFDIPAPPTFKIAAFVLDAVAILFVLGIIASLPLAIPGPSVDKSQIGYQVSPEDYTRLWNWITFTWVYPLVKRGTNNTLNEEDIWALSPTIQCRPVFYKFDKIKKSSLLRRIFAANSLDLILDFTLTILSVCFNYAGPVFMKRILDVLDNDDPVPDQAEQISRAYIYAMLAFLASVCKAQSDVQHLWFGRRASTRIRNGLMASIYEKALKRKDFSGIVDSKDGSVTGSSSATKAGNGKSTKKESGKGNAKKGKENKADESKSGADIGKIVQLMSGDTNRIANMNSGLYMLYGAPMEITLAMILLYNLMGISAFAGVICLIVGSPLNSFLARRSLRIQKDLLAARDKRMGVVNEVVTSVKFIKFFAWEEKWIGRVNEARKNEIKWLIKARLNSICLMLLWSTIPVLVSISAFTAYVLLGNTLTVSVAFTAIALFQMLRLPLNVIPTWIVMLLQSKVSLDRIETFLDEPEVDDEISSLKKKNVSAHTASAEVDVAPLGFKKASFRWNSTESVKSLPSSGTGERSPSLASADDSASVTSGDVEAVRFELRDISVSFPQGKLTVVTGPTASGKTALMLALLGEMTKLEGELLLDKEPLKQTNLGFRQYMSYAAQSPWLQHASVQKNILFGEPMDPVRYEAVLEACALKPDLAIFEDGDETEIGARGVSLSGGQKARVALARAVYARTQYVLLDDPLSAVDSHTARHLYEKLLKGPLLESRTVVLITHHVELVLPGTYYILRMLDGRIDEQGVVSELRASGKLDYIAHDAEMHIKEELEQKKLQETTADDNAAAVTDAEEQKVVKAPPRKLVQDEERQEGAVKWKVYNKYLQASSYMVWLILLSLILLQQGFGALEKLWIKTWGEAYKNAESFVPNVLTYFIPSAYSDLDGFEHQFGSTPLHVPRLLNSGSISTSTISLDLPSPYVHPMFYVFIYSAIGLGVAAISVTGSLVQLTGALRASRRLFRELLDNVVYATIRFHDTTPAGRLLNRFSKDIETIDVNLASSLQQVNSSIATFFASLLIVSVVFPGFLIPATVIGFVYIKLGIGYLNTGRDLRRMESNSRSPIFSGFAELLDGIVTVRAFSAERRFLNSLFAKIDLTTQMWYTFWMTNRWLLLHYDFLGAVSVLITTLLSLSGRVEAGFAGLTITSAMSFTSSIYWTCRFWTSLELDLNSVERVVEYLGLPQEPPAVIESNRPPAYWPSSSNDKSMLVVENLVVKYSPELPAVLHGISFTLKGKERVGLLGRTGSGKSTLAMSLLRFVDPTEGSIIIDGINITTIGLNDLRSRLTFIPQDATLFTGTIRDNLDPFGEYTDVECLDVLARVQMLSHSTHTSQRSSRAPSIHEEEAVSATVPEPSDNGASSTTIVHLGEGSEDERVAVTLDTKVSAGGVNFSQGQRQLLAMARALLRNSSVIIMDEATSSIDFKTDAKIQATIRDEFQNSLLLTVAHRLRTVIDYDRLIVLDQGRMVEFDTPYNLIKKENGVFRNMCLNSGTFQELEAIAVAKHLETPSAA